MRYQQTNERRAVILMVVLALLTLFAIIGITFVLYADAEAASARVAREAETQTRADVDPQQALAFFLGQLLYDVPDATGYGSALRGYSLARTMFGFNNQNPPGNATPYNGVGRLHTGPTTNWPAMNPWGIDDYQLINYTYFAGDGFARDPEWYGNKQTVPGANHYIAGANPNTSTFFVGCNAPYTYPDFNNLFLAAIRSDGTVLAPSFHRAYQGANFFGTLDPSNPNWTAPNPALKYMVLRPRPIDHNGFPATEDAGGDVRNVPWSKGGIDPITGKAFQNDSFWMDPGAPIMTAPDGTMYKMLFAPCILDLDNRLHVGAAGNIKGNNIASRSNQGWFPSEVNLSTLWSTDPTPAYTADWLNVFMGYPPATPPTGYYGKYGQNQTPSGALFPAGSPAHWYAQADLDGSNELAAGAATPPIFLPGTNALAPATIPFPYFPQGYGSGSIGERTNHPAAYSALAATGGDLIFYPSDMEQVLRPNSSLGATVDSGSSALISYLTRLCPNSLGAGTTITQRRNWITTISSDLIKPGISPWIYDPFNVASYLPTVPTPPLFPYQVQLGTPFLAPAGGALPFPSFLQRQTQASIMPPLPPAPPLGSDFTGNAPSYGWRSAIATQGRLDLNQPLPPFPHMSSGATVALVAPTARYDSIATNVMAAPVLGQFQSAMQARQLLALGIYNRLVAVAGVPAPSSVLTPSVADLAPRRWLAQLAVNIVDYIDDDEISTPFNFFDPNNGGNPASPSGTNIAKLPTPYQVDNTPGTPNTAVTLTVTTIPAFPGPAPAGNPDIPAYWVFGTELPRIVINEVLGEYTLPTNNMSPPQAAAGNFNVNVWVELFNPLPPAATVTATQTANGSILQPMDTFGVPLYMPANGAAVAYNPYQLVISNNGEIPLPVPPAAPVTTPIPNSQGLWYNAAGLNNNVLGTPQQLRYSNPAGAGTPAICNFQTFPVANSGLVGTVANPATGTYNLSATGLPGQGYLLVGPSATDVNSDITAAAGVPGTTPIYTSPTEMSYQVAFNPTPPAGQSQWTITVPGVGAGVSIYDNTNGIAVLLRRLANPHLPPNPFLPTGLLTNPALPPNPYITVDYASQVPLNGYGMNGAKPPAPVLVSTFAAPIPTNNSPAPAAGPASYGKLQPYASTFNQYITEAKAAGAVNHHTLGLANLPLAVPFTWLVHLDRMLISPMELLHVSGFAPHQLTQRFIIPNGNASLPAVPQPYNYTLPLPPNCTAFQHYAPWFNQANRLYRLFELVQTHDGASGLSASVRVPGKININTLWDPPTTYPLIYQAIADPPTPPTIPNNPSFNSLNVQAIFQKLLTLRTPNLVTPVAPYVAAPALSQLDRPFLGMAAGVSLPPPPALPTPDPQYPPAYGFPNGNGINHTLLTSGVAGTQPTAGAALQLPPIVGNIQTTHPYLQNELLTKIYNNLTTRSNVFAVFVTVGFFQVNSVNGVPIMVPGTTIPQLGPEIGRSEGRQIRHRMFAIVDRSQLTQFTGPLAVPYDPRSDPNGPQVVPYFSIID